MKFHVAQLLSILPAVVSAQRPTNTSICDYYTNALLGGNNASAQYTVLTLLVNTAVIGNWTANKANVMVNGILNPGMYDGTSINLLPYFDGSLMSTNRSGVASSVNFLDGGGAAPLKMGMASNNSTSNQERLLTHLYEYFGALLGCTGYGQMGFPSYAGRTGMAAVHGFMAIGPKGNGYFISQVGAAAASFGVASADITVVANALNSTFNYKCAAPIAVLPSAPVELQSICQASACPIAPNNTCAAYPAVVAPMNATSSGTSGSSTSSMASGSASPTAAAQATKNAAPSNAPVMSGLASVVLGLLGLIAL